MLSEMCQAEKDGCHGILLVCGIQRTKWASETEMDPHIRSGEGSKKYKLGGTRQSRRCDVQPGQCSPYYGESVARWSLALPRSSLLCVNVA